MPWARSVVLCAFLLGPTAGAQTVDQLLVTRFDPSVKFLTVETPHFRIHFAEGLEQAAEDVFNLAEPVYEAVTSRLRWWPTRRTDLVLISNNDRTNAFTVFHPSPQIQMTVGPPSLMQGIPHYGDWLRWLLVHEFTHVVHIDMARGGWARLRPLMGSTVRPNHFEPVWFQEGLAVLAETAMDSSGRAGSSTYRMMLRAAYREGDLGRPSFGTMSSASYSSGESWPWIHRSYLWGSVLVQAMEAGSDGAAARFAAEGSRQAIPGIIGSSLTAAGFASAGSLQRKAVQRAGAEAFEELSILSRRAETDATRLTRDGQNKFGLSVDPEGTELLFTSERPETDSHVVGLSLSGGGGVLATRKRFFHQAGYQLSFSRSGRYVAYDDVDSYKKFNFYSDLFLHDVDTDQTVLRSSGLRGRDPDIHPDGRHLAFVAFDGINSKLARCDSGFGSIETLNVPLGSERLAEPRFSPDGSLLVFIEHVSATGGERLMLRESGGSVRPLTDGTSIDRDPAWSPDGRYVLFSSDRSGAAQIFSLLVETGDVKQVTHRYGGAFWPQVDPKGRFLYFLDYSGKGYDVVRMQWNPEGWWVPDPNIWIPKRLAPSSTLESPQPVVTPLGGPPFEPSQYRGWRYLKPTYLSPAFSLRHDGSLWGMQTGSVDPAYLRLYMARLLWGRGDPVPQGEFLFFDGSKSTPWRFLAARDRHEIQSDLTLDVLTADVSLFIQPGQQRTYSSLQFGLQGQRYSRMGVTQHLVGAVARIEANDLLAQPNDLVPETGRRLLVEASSFARQEGSPVTSIKASADLPFRLSVLGKHAVTTFSAAAGQVWSGAGPSYLLHGGGSESFPFSRTSSFPIPALEPNQVAGQRIASFSVVLSKPVLTLQRGLSTWPLYVGRVALGLRFDAAFVALGGVGTSYTSLGAEALVETEFTRRLPVLWSLSWYRGQGPSEGGHRVVLRAKIGG